MNLFEYEEELKDQIRDQFTSVKQRIDVANQDDLQEHADMAEKSLLTHIREKRRTIRHALYRTIVRYLPIEQAIDQKMDAIK